MKRAGLLVLLFAWAQIGLAAATDEEGILYGSNPSAPTPTRSLRRFWR
jgi:predicted secreted protein